MKNKRRYGMDCESFESITGLPPLNDGMEAVDLFTNLVDKRCAEWIEYHPHNEEFQPNFKLGWFKAELAFYISMADPELVQRNIQRYKEI
jgi:hypothetical protein